jgi:hypothetical protein
LNRISSFFLQGRSQLCLEPGRVALWWYWDTAQGRLRVEATKPWQCPSETAQTLGPMQQHLFMLQMHTYKVQEGVTACGWSPHRTPGQVRLVLHRGAPPSSQVIQAENARSLGGRATTWQDLSYLGERSSGKERRMQDRVL